MTDLELMQVALEEARLAFEEGEVPVGAVIARDGEIVARAHNRREGEKNALCHAELLAIDAACRALGGWRLVGCTLYVTLEPCPMCAGAILNAQLKHVKVGAADEKMGAFGGCVDLRGHGLFRSEVSFGLLEEESRSLLRDFFSSLRRKREKQE
ncbi:MAG: nucleoside deaminase [Clostridia bacterium]|nr:nucleoside deaminase [Clostridia bacterium]